MKHYILLFSITILLTCQSCKTHQIIVSVKNNDKTNTKSLIRNKVIAPWIKTFNYSFSFEDTVVHILYEAGAYGVYRWGANKTNHTSSKYYIVIRNNDKIYTTYQTNNWCLQKKHLNLFYKGLHDNNIIVAKEKRNEMKKQVKNLINTNKEKVASNVW